MNKRVIVSVMIAIMLATFGTAPPANAIVPALAWAVWGIAAGVTGIAVVADETSDHKQAQANNQGQEEPKDRSKTASELQQNPG